MQDLLDVHMHTLASGHAYSTVREMIDAAKSRGLSLVGISEHGPAMQGSCPEIYFCNFKVIRYHAQEFGIDVRMGAELNIMDYNGSVDLSAQRQKDLDYAIASLHNHICIEAGTREENTRALLGAMQNPRVNIIGHPDNPEFPVDFDAVAKAARETHTLLELNNSSYRPNGSRKGSYENGKHLLAACKKYGTEIIFGSDAHFYLDVGAHEYSEKLARECDFPKELIANYDLAKFKSYIE